MAKFDDSTLLSLEIVQREVRALIPGVTDVQFTFPGEDQMHLQIEREHDGVTMPLDALDLALSLEDFSERVLAPIAAVFNREPAHG